jgi:integrase
LILKPVEASDDCFHGRSVSAEAADNRAASSLDIGWSSAEKYCFSPGPKRIYKELTPMKKEQLDLENAVVWIPDSKTPNGVAEVPLTAIAVGAFRGQLAISGPGPCLFPSDENPDVDQKSFKTVWRLTLRRAGVGYFRIYDLHSTYATRLSTGGVADEWVTQLLRQGDAKVFKKYSHMKLQMKRKALAKLNRQANESGVNFGTAHPS